MTSNELKAYAKAGAIAEEVFSSIRTVFAYNGASYESKRSTDRDLRVSDAMFGVDIVADTKCICNRPKGVESVKVQRMES